MNIPMIRRLLALVCGAQLFFALPAGAAEDERFTTFHGTICRTTKQPGMPFTWPLLFTAGLGNTDPSAMTFDCPVPVVSRQKNTFLSAMHATSAPFTDKCDRYSADRRPWVEVYDRSATADVSCTLYVLGDGNAVQSQYTVTSTSQNQGPSIRLLFPVNNYLMLPENSRLHVRCTVPGKSPSDWSWIARFGFNTCEGDPPASTATLNPVADAHVRDGTNAGTNFGTATSLEQKNSSVAGNVRRTFLRFPLAGLGSTISSAKLRLYGASVTSAKAVGVYATSTSWAETTINFNNAPAIGAKQGSSTSVGLTAAYVEWDLAAYVQAQRTGGASEVSFEVKQDVANNEAPTTFNSREAASNKPQLVVTSQ
jgi:hypothetical protein